MRVDYLNNPNAPKANSLIPAASAVVMNNEGKILLHRRSDSNTWSLPGGTMEIGESISETVKREVKEETGLDIEPEYIIGIYSNPEHIVAYSDGEVRQEFSICFSCKIVRGNLKVSEESFELAFFTPQEIEQLNMHEAMRLRIKHYLEHKNHPVIT
ncbi:MAG: NUDIX domain-containing protein [Ktedonobacteraceae bacterium]